MARTDPIARDTPRSSQAVDGKVHPGGRFLAAVRSLSLPVPDARAVHPSQRFHSAVRALSLPQPVFDHDHQVDAHVTPAVAVPAPELICNDQALGMMVAPFLFVHGRFSKGCWQFEVLSKQLEKDMSLIGLKLKPVFHGTIRHTILRRSFLSLPQVASAWATASSLRSWIRESSAELNATTLLDSLSKSLSSCCTFCATCTMSSSSFHKCRSLQFGYRWLCDIDECILLLRWSSSAKRSLKTLAWKAHLVVNTYKMAVCKMWLSFSKFVFHCKLNHILESAVDLLRVREATKRFSTSNCIYIMLNPNSQYSYVGRTRHTFATRHAQHYNQLFSHVKNQNELPAYRPMRSCGVHQFVGVPLAFLSRTTHHEILLLEQFLIKFVRPKLNSPYVLSLCGANFEGSGHASVVMKKRQNSIRTQFWRKSRPNFFCQKPKFSNNVSFDTSIMQFANTKAHDLNKVWCQNGLSLILQRICDPKRRGRSAIVAMKRLLSNKPSLLPSLTRRICTGFEGIFKAVGLERPKSITKELRIRESILRITFELPVVPYFGNTKKLTQTLASMIRATALTADDSHVLARVRVKQVEAPSLKSFCNTSRWKRQVDNVDFPCCCVSLACALGIPWDHSTSGHFCFPATETSMRRWLPNTCSLTPPMVPSFSWIKWVIRKSCMKLPSPLCYSIDHEKLTSIAATDLRRGKRPSHFHQGDWMTFMQEISSISVLSELDKSKFDLCISCPRGWQLRLVNFAIKSNMLFDAPSPFELHRDFEHMALRMQYSKAYILKSHRFGNLSILPKASSPTTKVRPLGDYSGHMLKNVFSVACQVINWLLPEMFGNLWWFSNVISTDPIIKDCHRFNTAVAKKQEQGMVGTLVCYKTDIDSFFNAVPHDLVICAFAWLLKSFKDHFKRRISVSVPAADWKNFKKKIGSKLFRRTFGHALRCKGSTSLDKPYVQNNRVVGWNRKIMVISNLLLLVRFDMAHGWLRLGTSLCRSPVGIAQGSSLSPGIAAVVCSYLEWQSQDHLLVDFRVITMMAHRWVDDLFIAVVACDRHRQAGYNNHCRANRAHDIAIAFPSVYEPSFALKAEDPSIFVGLHVSSCNNTLGFRPRIRGKTRLQHFTSGKPLGSRLAVLHGQICAVLDKSSSSSDLALRSMHDLFLTCTDAGFPTWTIHKAVATLTARHPYLDSLLGKALRRLDYDAGG